ncbi:MAG TPA: metal-dependent hydrolase [Methanoregula sp.]|nr:metal-dependent hydrolase [Methanoregula sp.]
MITRHHLVLTLICGSFFCTAVAGTDPWILIFLLAGTCTGTILPDIHMKRPSKTRLLTISWFIVQTGRKIAVPVMCRILNLLPGIRVSPGDKRITHSVFGIVLFGTIYTSPALAVTVLAPDSYGGMIALAFSAGLFLGMVIHLCQDLCTRKGITPLFPFCHLNVHGSIRPCDIHDLRIPRFHVQHCAILLVFQSLLFLFVLPNAAILLSGFLTTALCAVWMVLQSDVQVDPNADQPVPADHGVAG